MENTEQNNTEQVERLEIFDVKVPVNYIPAQLPTVQRLLDSPRKFFTIHVRYLGEESTRDFFFLSDYEAIIDLINCALYYPTRRTRQKKVYRIPLPRSYLPRRLDVYAKGYTIYIRPNGRDLLVSVPHNGESKTFHDFIEDENPDPLRVTILALLQILRYLP